MSMDPSDINSWVQSYGGPQLRTFSKTINVYTNVYTQGTAGMTSGTSAASTNHTFEYTGASDSIYNGYYDGLSLIHI